MVERQLPKLHTRVRFPSPAPEFEVGASACPEPHATPHDHCRGVFLCPLPPSGDATRRAVVALRFVGLANGLAWSLLCMATPGPRMPSKEVFHALPQPFGSNSERHLGHRYHHGAGDCVGRIPGPPGLRSLVPPRTWRGLARQGCHRGAGPAFVESCKRNPGESSPSAVLATWWSPSALRRAGRSADPFVSATWRPARG